MRELAELQIDYDEAAEPAVKKQQIHSIPLTADAQPALPADEGEVAPELEQKRLQLLDHGVLEVGLRVLVLQRQELYNIRVLDLIVRRNGIVRLRLNALTQHGGLIARQRRALVELRLDLAVKLADGPAATQGFGLVKRAGLRVLDRQKPGVVRP